MTVEEMQYEFKRRINKIDSQQKANLLPQEVDMILNEAQIYFIKTVAEPRLRNHLGIETTQRTIDDIRTVVIDDYKCVNVQGLSDKFALPDDYMYFVKGYAICSNEHCLGVKCGLYIQKHNDMFEQSEFAKSSFKWRTINAVFNSDGLMVYLPDDASFDAQSQSDGVYISYVKYPKRIAISAYNLPGYSSPTVRTDCELPEQTHSEIVDIAVAFASGALSANDYQLKLNKLTLNELK